MSNRYRIYVELKFEALKFICVELKTFKIVIRSVQNDD